jgi:hypothetical protein
MKNRIAVILICVVIVGGGLAAYIAMFGKHPFSHEPGPWGAFGDFFNVFMATANLVIFYWFSNEVYKYNADKDRKDDEFKKATERPIIIFRSRKNNPGNECWEVMNIGKGAALNLRITELVNGQTEWEKPIKCYSLGNGDESKLLLPWTTNSGKLVVRYTDVFNTGYYSITVGDETQVLVENVPEPIKIGNETYDLAFFRAITEGESERLAEAYLRYDESHITTLL